MAMMRRACGDQSQQQCDAESGFEIYFNSQPALTQP
jgi:hypothetical protein